MAGAHAKGCADPGSDIDFFLYVNEWKPFEEREALIRGIADPDGPRYLSKDLEENVWGSNMDFSYHGIPVETTVRSIREVERITDECLQGKFEVIPVGWTTNGYFSYVYLSELSFVQPIDDEKGILANLKKKADPYPQKLRRAIIDRFLGGPRSWLHNFHYHTAIEREDLLFVSALVEHMVLDLVQVIFAINEVYYKGDKKLERQLREMEFCPQALLLNLEELLSCPRNRKKLAQQRQILLTAMEEIEAKIQTIF